MVRQMQGKADRNKEGQQTKTWLRSAGQASGNNFDALAASMIFSEKTCFPSPRGFPYLLVKYNLHLAFYSSAFPSSRYSRINNSRPSL